MLSQQLVVSFLAAIHHRQHQLHQRHRQLRLQPSLPLHHQFSHHKD